MNHSDEIFDIVDEQDRVIGNAGRREIHRRRLRHRAVHLFLFDNTGRLYIQKRASTKGSFPGRFDSSASGHVDSGESYDAAVLRETREEIGLEFLPDELRGTFDSLSVVGRVTSRGEIARKTAASGAESDETRFSANAAYKKTVVNGDSLRKHFQIAACEETGQEFVWVYSARGNYQPVFNPAEIESARFWTLPEIEHHLAAHPDDWAPAFRLIFREFQQRLLKSH